MSASLKHIFMAHVKTSEGYDVKIPNQGEVTYGTVAGSLGIASFLGLNAGNILGGGLFGGWNNRMGASPMDMPVTRYELGMQQAIAAKDSEISLLKANTYQDQKSLELYKYIDGKFSEISSAMAAQAVRNQAVNDSIQALDYKTQQAIALEAERRECADSKIVNYVNSTFTPKLITDYTAGTTSAAAEVYNPLACGKCC